MKRFVFSTLRTCDAKGVISRKKERGSVQSQDQLEFNAWDTRSTRLSNSRFKSFMFVAILVVFAITSPLIASCELTERKDDEGVKQLFLENNFLRLRLTPDKGGRCTGLAIKKDGKVIEDFVVNLFDDMDWSKSFHEQPFSNTPYSSKILENSNTKIKVLLEARGTKDYPFFIVRKTITLNSDERVFRTDYEVHNLTESMGVYTFKLWCHNGLHARDMMSTYYWSAPSGIHEMKYPGTMNNWEYQSPREWTGIVNQPPSSGIACVLDYSRVMALYNWFGDHSANMEWRYLPVRIKNGESFTTSVWTLPFSGLDRLDYACDEAAFAWDISGTIPEAATLTIAPTMNNKLDFTFDLRNTINEKWSHLSSQKLSVTPERNAEIKIPLPKLDEARYVLRATMKTKHGTKIFERVFSVGSSKDKGEYTYKPIEKKMDYLKEKKYFPYKLSERFTTPCVKWFKPLDGKKIKALFIKDWLNTRPIVELNERLSLDYEAPPLLHSGYCFAGFIPPRSEIISSNVESKPFLKALENNLSNVNQDVIIIDSRPLWKDLNSKIRSSIIEKVTNGTALMIAAEQLRKCEDPELIKLFENATPVKEANGYKQKELIPNGARLVVYPDDNCKCYSTHDFGELLLWCVKRSQHYNLKTDLPRSGNINQCILHTNGLTLQIAPSAEGRTLDIEKVITRRSVPDRKLEIVWSETQKAIHTGTKLSFPWLPAGDFRLSLVLREASKAVGSLSEPLLITSNLKPSDFSLKNDIIRNGETIDGKLSVVNEGDTPLAGVGTIELIDNWGRLIKATSFKFSLAPKDKTIEKFSFDQKNPLSVIHNIKVSLEVDGEIYTITSREVTFPDFNYQDDDYLAFTWGAPGNCQGRQYAREILRDYCGFNLEQTHDGKSASKRNQKYFAHNIMGNAYNDWQNCKTLGIRKYCLTNPVTIKDVADKVERASETSSHYGAFALNMADEASLTHWETPSDLCGSPTCLKKYHEWLRKKYKTLDSLNAEWGTKLDSWEAAKPMTEAEAKQANNLSQWSDFREHMENIWTDFMKKMKKIKDEKTPRALFSICGVQGGHPYSGYNWWKLRDVFDFVMPYTSTAVLRSFNPQGKFGKYTGYRIAPSQQIKDSWKFFFDSQFVFSYFLSTYPVLPDLSIAPVYADPIREITKRFERGIGKAFIKTKRQDDKIAIHYSQPSIRINFMQKYREKEIGDFIKFYRDARADYENILKDLGYDPLYISYEEIEDGKLTPENYKMLILPISTALSPREVEAIKKYVTNGGIVIADCLTGLYNENGRPNKTGSLDELFGVRREALGKDRLSYKRRKVNGREDNILICQESGITSSQSKPLLNLESETKTKIDGYIVSEPCAGTELAFMNSTGKGKTVYLGFTSDYSKNPSQTNAASEIYRKILNAAGFHSPEINVMNHDGSPALCQVLRHRNPHERNLFFGLLRREELPLSDIPYKVELSNESYIYDMLSKKFITFGKTFDVKLTPGIGKLFSALPYKVSGIDIHYPSEVELGNHLPIEINVKTQDEIKPDFHLIRLEVIEPDGKTANYYTKNYEAPNGHVKTSLDIAMNAPEGKWTLKAKDVMTGIERTGHFEVKK